MDYRIEQLRYLLREDPSSRIFFQLGELLRREGEPEEAVEILKKGLERHPRYVAAWVALGRAHRDLKALDEAVSAFEIALEIDRENPVAARLLGETAAERQDWLGAVKALKLTRALAGGDEELDAKITQVEAFLEEDGRLEQAPVAPPPEVKKTERCLEVVSLSADDPFAPDGDDADDWGPTSDVFEVAEVESVDEIAVDDDDVTETETGSEAEAEAARETETATETETETKTETEVGAGTGAETETEAETESDRETGIEAPIVDEGSVGAWSAMKAAGVSGDEAWVEPTDEIVSGDEASTVDESWVDPAAEVTAADSDVAEEASATAEPEDGGGESTDEEHDESPDSDDVDETPPVELEDFDPIEVTHPDVMERRLIAAEAAEKAEAEAEAVARAVEEARLQAEAEAAAKAAAEAVAKAEEEARLQAEAEAAAKAEAEAAAKAEEEARLHAEAEAAAKAAAEATAKAEEEARLQAEVEAEAAATAEDEAAAVSDQRHKLSHGVPLPTMTLAKLALEQDDRPLAMATLESLLERDPTNVEAAELLDELRAEAAAVVNHHLRAVQATTKIAALRGWLDAVRLAAERRVQ